MFHLADAHAGAVDADGAPSRCRGGEPFRHVDGILHAQLVQLDARALQLLCGLDEVARVRPQPGMILRDADGAIGAGEAADEAALLPAGRSVLTVVRVGAGDDDGVPAFTLHDGAESMNAFGDHRTINLNR